MLFRFGRFRADGGLNTLDIEGMKLLMDKSGEEGGQLRLLILVACHIGQYTVILVCARGRTSLMEGRHGIEVVATAAVVGLLLGKASVENMNRL